MSMKMRKKVSLMLGIIVLSMFIFIQPIKAENEIIGVYPVEVVSGEYADFWTYAQWDSDGILIYASYERVDGTSMYIGNRYDTDGETTLNSMYLQFEIPNNTKEIKSMKLRLRQNYYTTAYINETDIMPIKVEMVNNSWNYDIENVITYYMNWSKRPEGMGITTLTEWTDLTTYGHKYIELTSFVDYIENETLSISIESLSSKYDNHELGFSATETGIIDRKPILIIEYKEECFEIIPHTEADNVSTLILKESVYNI